MLTIVQIAVEEYMAQLTAEDVGCGPPFPPGHPCCQAFDVCPLKAATVAIGGTLDLFRIGRGLRPLGQGQIVKLAPTPPGRDEPPPGLLERAIYGPRRERL